MMMQPPVPPNLSDELQIELELVMFQHLQAAKVVQVPLLPKAPAPDAAPSRW